MTVSVPRRYANIPHGECHRAAINILSAVHTVDMSLSVKAISSIGWRGGTNLFRISILFVRSIILARLLSVEIFGIYAGAMAIVSITAVLFNFGLGGAFLYISNQEISETRAAATHFTLNMAFKTAWAMGLISGAFLFLDGLERMALIILTLANFILMSTYTPQLILSGRVEHRRLAILDAVVDGGATIAAVTLAYLGFGLWALLAINIVAGLVSVIFLFLYRPFWKPHFSFSRDLIRRFLNFGWRNVWADLLQVLLNKIDDLWTVTFLGTYAMGLYSRAYAFAIYPQRIIATPVNSVSLGLYAKLADDRERLSQAFFRINALLIRAGFLLAGMLALIAPEFIHLIIGEKWLPFLDAYRLMLLFTLLDPIKLTVGYLFVAVGKPEQVVRIRLIQFAVLMIGLFTIGSRWGITGVALAVDIMLLVGIWLLLWRAQEYVTFSVRKLFQAPLIALSIGFALVILALQLPQATSSYWSSAFVKLMVFTPAYIVLILGQERQELEKMLAVLNLDRWKK